MMLVMTCHDCGRDFDMRDESDADEWAHGHDCEVTETCSWCTKPTVDTGLFDARDGARICAACWEAAPTIDEDDGRVRIRSGSVATCSRCDFRSGLTECLCDHWHECSDGHYQPHCDAPEEH